MVTGEGSVSVAPTEAQIGIGVTVRGNTVTEALNGNSQRMAAVIAALKSAGVADNDIQTARFSLQPISAIASTQLREKCRDQPLLRRTAKNELDDFAVNSFHVLEKRRVPRHS